MKDRLDEQLAFLLECDKMKSIYRQTYIIADEDRGAAENPPTERGSIHRRENDAEHTFHLALFAVILAECADEKIDLLKTLKMLLVHDIVEIDAGDTYAYDTEGYKTKAEREAKAADRLFSLLPADQRDEYRSLWEEFESGSTPESRFANAVDHMQPLLLNYSKGGLSWRQRGVAPEKVKERSQVVGKASARLGEYISDVLDKAVNDGYFEKDGTLT